MFRPAALVFIMLATVLAGVGVVFVLCVPSLEAQSKLLIPAVTAVAVLVAIPISIMISKQIQAN